MSATTTQPAQAPLEQEVAHAILASSACLEKAALAYQEKEAQDREVAALIPSVVDALAGAGMIEPEEKEACKAACANPVKALHLLKHAAEFKAQAAAGALPAIEVNGSGQAVKTAGARPPQLLRPVGARQAESEADRVFDATLFG